LIEPFGPPREGCPDVDGVAYKCFEAPREIPKAAPLSQFRGVGASSPTSSRNVLVGFSFDPRSCCWAFRLHGLACLLRIRTCREMHAIHGWPKSLLSISCLSLSLSPNHPSSHFHFPLATRPPPQNARAARHCAPTSAGGVMGCLVSAPAVPSHPILPLLCSGSAAALQQQ
jgi:hypothetical protein